ncbi:unnamed protein product [Ectocarpus sp. 12 AP-2014]
MVRVGTYLTTNVVIALFDLSQKYSPHSRLVVVDLIAQVSKLRRPSLGRFMRADVSTHFAITLAWAFGQAQEVSLGGASFRLHFGGVGRSQVSGVHGGMSV